MKVVLLAGGLGTRLSEETARLPKPMVEIGGMPILAHIMHIYEAHGFQEFVVACGYKGEVCKEYFLNLEVRSSDWEVDLGKRARVAIRSSLPPWKITLVDTGLHTMTGGRLLRLRELLDGQTFMATYGDGVSNVNLTELLEFHRAHGRLATVTAVRPPARFGGLELDGDVVQRFSEKSQAQEGWINGGFFVFEPGVLDYLDDDATILEKSPLERLSRDGQLLAYRHDGFWQPMDTLREKQLLEELWLSGQAPWKVWNDNQRTVPLLSRPNRAGDGTDGLQGSVARKVA